MVALDVIFSIDSIIAALGVSKNPIIILIGGLIGILAMRLVAKAMVKLMVKIPEWNVMAYIFILLIEVKLLIFAPLREIEIPDWFFAIFLLACVGITLGIHHLRRNKLKNKN